MKRGNKWYTVGLLLVILVYCTAYYLLQHNLAVTSAALAAQPVTVVIDAGHGGEDGGTSSVSGMKESELNLSIALRLEQVLGLCGIRTSMIRIDDSAVHTEGNTVSERKVSDLKQRVRHTKEAEPAVLVSIHQNHFPDGKYKGAQVFYAGTNGSKQLAQRTQELLCETLDPGNRREIKAADSVYLMEQISCTGILVECGFLSNPLEDQLLQKDVYQKKIACVLGAALAQYLEEGNNRFEV